MHLFAEAVEGARERPQRFIPRQKDTMTDGPVILLNPGVNRSYLRPCPAAVVADAIAAFFRVRVFASLVVTKSGVEPAFVPGQSHTVQKPVAIQVALIPLDNVELHTAENFGC